MSCGGACAPLIRSPTTLISNEALRLAQCRSVRRQGGVCRAPGHGPADTRTLLDPVTTYQYYFDQSHLGFKCTPHT